MRFTTLPGIVGAVAALTIVALLLFTTVVYVPFGIYFVAALAVVTIVSAPLVMVISA